MTDELMEPLREDPGLPTADLDPEEFEAGATQDPIHAAELGEPWFPPIDPPSDPDGEGDIDGAGFGPDKEIDADAASTGPIAGLGADDMTRLVREHLEADALGSQYVDQLEIVADGSGVEVAGLIEDLDAQEYLLALVASVPGVRSVKDRLRLE